eukprot:4325436-Prymnesium_polylepis.1
MYVPKSRPPAPGALAYADRCVHCGSPGQTFPIIALSMLRPSVSLAVWLQMYGGAHTGVAPDIGCRSLARLHNVSWLRC